MLIVAKLAIKYPAFNRTNRCCTIFTKTCH